MIFSARDFTFSLLLGVLFSLAACASVDDVANRIDPNREQEPQYLILTCQDTSVEACHLGVGGAKNTHKTSDGTP